MAEKIKKGKGDMVTIYPINGKHMTKPSKVHKYLGDKLVARGVASFEPGVSSKKGKGKDGSAA